jgi:hypothetical protein
VPNGDVTALLAVAERYDVEYLLLDWNYPAPLAALYAGEEVTPLLCVSATWGEEEKQVVLYAIERSGEGCE